MWGCLTFPSTCETRMTPPRTKCSEQYWHAVVRTTDLAVSKFLPFLFQNAPGIVLQLQALLASLLFTNDRQVSSLGQCSRCPGHPGTWHSTERWEGRWQSLAEQWDGLRSRPKCPSSPGSSCGSLLPEYHTRKVFCSPHVPAGWLQLLLRRTGTCSLTAHCEQIGNTRARLRSHCVFNRVAAVSLPESLS